MNSAIISAFLVPAFAAGSTNVGQDQKGREPEEDLVLEDDDDESESDAPIDDEEAFAGEETYDEAEPEYDDSDSYGDTSDSSYGAGSSWEDPAEVERRRDGIRSTYRSALRKFNELELEVALGLVEEGIGTAEQSGGQSDPMLAALYVMKAALLYSTAGDGAQEQIVSTLKQAIELNYYIAVPLEMRSEGLSAYLQQARGLVSSIPSTPIVHETPPTTCGEDLQIEALVAVPDGGQAALYWRASGGGEFRAQEMTLFANVAQTTISSGAHADSDIEYFIYVFDESNEETANLGSQEAPLTLRMNCEGAGVEGYKPIDPDSIKKSKKKGDSALPRVWINLGLGMGMGIAKGQVENTYLQFFPDESGYNLAQHGCAIARWQAAGGGLADAANLSGTFSQYGAPGFADQLGPQYASAKGSCESRQEIDGGLAFAPFHIAPEFAFKIGERFSIGIFSRLQVVTGAKMYNDDPSLSLEQSFNGDVRSGDPAGVQVKSAFTWAAGIKGRYFFGADESKFRPYAGGFAGYGHSRLRVDLGFGQDRNGNSVPDDREVAFFNSPGDDIGDPSDDVCIPVWPYINACSDDESLAAADQNLAQQVRNNAGSETRVDTVKIGPAFVGALVGFNYQIVENFAVFGELQVGGWFPNSGSLLFDLTLGPAITF